MERADVYSCHSITTLINERENEVEERIVRVGIIRINETHVSKSIFSLRLICAAINTSCPDRKSNKSPSSSGLDVPRFFFFFPFSSIPVTVFQQWACIPINSKIITRTRLHTIPWRSLLFYWYLDRINTSIPCIHSTRYRSNGEHLLRSWPKGPIVHVVNSIIERQRYGCHITAGLLWKKACLFLAFATVIRDNEIRSSALLRFRLLYLSKEWTTVVYINMHRGRILQ